MFDQFRGPHFTLLLFNGTAKETGYGRLALVARQVEKLFRRDVETRIVVPTNTRPAAMGSDEIVLLDPDQEAHKTYGAKAESLYLVRPDGYIGFRSQAAEAEPLIEYLDRLFFLEGKHSRISQETSVASKKITRELRVMISGNRSPLSLRVAK